MLKTIEKPSNDFVEPGVGYRMLVKLINYSYNFLKQP